MNYFRKRWLGFIVLLLCNLSMIGSHLTLTMFGCDKDTLKEYESIVTLFAIAFKTRNMEPAVIKLEDRHYAIISFSEGYATLMIFNDEAIVKVEVISNKNFDIDDILDRLDKFIKPSYFIITDN